MLCMFGIPISPGVGMAVLAKTNFQLNSLWMFYIADTSPEELAGGAKNALSEALSSKDAFQNTLSNFRLSNLIGSAVGAVDSVTMATLCKKVTLPRPSLSTETHGQTNRKYYTKVDALPPVTLEFWETEAHDVENYFTHWETSFVEREQKVFIAGQNPKRQGYLTVFQKSSVGDVTGLTAGLRGGLNGILNKTKGGRIIAGGINAIGNTANELASWVPTGNYHYEGLSFKGLESMEFDHEQGGGMSVRVNLEVDSVTPLQLGAVDWATYRGLALQGARWAQSMLGKFGL